MANILNSLQEVVVERPTDIIIRQIKDLISSSQLNPGDKLPSERKLSEKLGVGRTHVRDAIKKLEFYGILRTLPQSGTVVVGLEVSAIEGLISDVLKLDSSDFYSLTETRLIIERNTLRLCALRRTDEDLNSIERALINYEQQAQTRDNLVEEDFTIHRAYADGCKNPVLKSLLLIITPDLLSTYMRLRVCSATSDKTIREHRTMYEQIKNRDAEGVIRTINQHLENICTFAKEQSSVSFAEN
ncbi:MAG: FadR family transcriptional regulator [Prevotellaceae bacterium]|jgi:GntR family transcriptional repressor for pyruvate dehydrogenase complex|nr:FadR family transcriptional regulator [Prevotellaceae bacterium]